MACPHESILSELVKARRCLLHACMLNNMFLSFSLPAWFYSTCLGPLKLSADAFIHLFLFKA
ncbi:unnamed protein product [Prunus armeniaca]